MEKQHGSQWPDGTGEENRGDAVSKGAGGQVVLDLEGHGEHSESLSDSSSVSPPWIPALARSSPGGGRWMGKKSRSNSQAAREPSLRVGNAGPGGWPRLPCGPSHLYPPLCSPSPGAGSSCWRPGGKLTMLDVLKYPEELGLVSGNKRRYQIVGSLPSPL